MTSFILDGTSLPFPKLDLVPLGSAPANKYSVASDWNTVCQASVDMQSFLRGNFLLFKSDDLSTRAALLLSAGAPLMVAQKGSLALDVTTPAVYQNQDGAATWMAIGGGGGSMAIGSPVTGGTVGSVLFVGASTFLQQDNANFFYDNTSKLLGLGTTTPGTTLDISSSTTTAGLAMRAGSTTPVSAAGTGRLRYNEGTSTFQVSLNGAAYTDLTTAAPFTLDIGDAIGGSTVGSILFVGAGNVLQQDNASLFFDNTNNRLGVNTATPGAVSLVGHAIFSARSGADVLEIKSTVTDGYSTLWFTDSADVHQTSFGFGNSTVAIVRLRGKHYLYGVNDFLIDDTTAIAMAFKPTANSVSLEMFNGGSGAVSSANAGRIRYTTAGQKFQVSYNGAAYIDLATGTGMAIGTAITGATAGSVLFAGVGGILQQDNTNFFWDDTLNTLTLTRNADIAPNLTIKNLHASGEAEVHFQDASSAGKFSFGYSNPGNDSYWYTVAGVPINIYTATLHRMRVAAGGNVGIGTGAVDAGYKLEVQNTGASQFHISNGVVDSGGYLTSTVPSQMYISGGLAFDGTNLRAKATTAAVIELNTAAISFQTATGLTIGAISAMTERMLLHSAGGLEILNSDAATVSLASRGKIRYTTSGQKFQVSANTGAYFDVATYATTPLVANAVLFANSSNQIAQNNPFFTWDNVQHNLGVASDDATESPLFVQSIVTTGPSAMGCIDSSTVFKSYWGYFNSTYAFTYMQSKNGVLAVAGNIIFGNSTIATHEFGMTTGSLFFEMFNGGSAAVSSANAGRIRYTTTGQKFQVSMNGAAYVDLATGTPTVSVERLSVDGAASPTIDVTYVSGTGTDLTLANGTQDGFLKTFIVTGGSGTITPANLADGDVLTYAATPANVCFRWDATAVTWHVVGSPYNMVTT